MYQIILYNRGKRVKTIKNYQLYGNAIKKYRTLLRENQVFFPRETLWNGVPTDYELVLTAPAKNRAKEFFRNEFGARVNIKPKGNFVIKQVTKYYVEDHFKHKITGKRYNFKTMIRDLLKNRQLTYVIIVIQNKVVIERFENEDMDVFVLKNKDASQLLVETLRQFNNTNHLTNFIYFQDPSLDTRMRIYEHLEERYDISRDYMQRLSTR